MKVIQCHGVSLAGFPLQFFAKKKFFFFQISTQYNCNLLLFPLNSVMCISRNAPKNVVSRGPTLRRTMVRNLCAWTSCLLPSAPLSEFAIFARNQLVMWPRTSRLLKCNCKKKECFRDTFAICFSINTSEKPLYESAKTFRAIFQCLFLLWFLHYFCLLIFKFCAIPVAATEHTWWKWFNVAKTN